MPIAIAGMHRSGTSMVAQFLHRCGVYLGADATLMPAAAENPDGFWEHIQIVEVNEELLSLLGGGWDYPPLAPADWRHPRFDHLRTRAARILADFRGHDAWGWKDPRTSLTLPFWRSVVDDPRVVAVVRNPLEVAISLRRRNGFSVAHGLALWQATYRQLLTDTTPDQRILTHYDAYFGRPAAEFARMLRFLDLPGNQAVIAELADATRTTDRRHHRFTVRDLIEADVADAVLDLYQALCREAEWADEGSAPHPTADQPARTSTEPLPDPSRPVPWAHVMASSLVPGIGQTSRAAVELAMLRWDLGEHKRVTIHQQTRIEHLEAVLAERDSTIAERGSAIAERDNLILDRERRLAHLTAVLRQRDEQIKHLTEANAALARTIAEIQASASSDTVSAAD